MNLRENFLKLLNHEQTDLIPSFFTATHGTGFGALPGPWIEKGPMGGGYDGFGVRWVTPASGSGAPIPAPGEFVLDDVTNWKKLVKFPDLDAFDWQESSARELQGCDREEKAVEFGCGNGIFERLGALMGFEESLCAMYTEPEACFDLFSAITDYKIKLAEKVAQYYKPDTFTNYDDIATERNLFMSPETYRKLIKPHHKRLSGAVKALGMIPIYHCCGKAESIIEDMIDCGYAAWTSVQPTNDIVGLLQKYGDKIALLGGYDTNGRPAMSTATEDEVRGEVRRCYDQYGKYKGYGFFGFKIVNSLDPNAVLASMLPMIQESATYSMVLAAK